MCHKKPLIGSSYPSPSTKEGGAVGAFRSVRLSLGRLGVAVESAPRATFSRMAKGETMWTRLQSKGFSATLRALPLSLLLSIIPVLPASAFRPFDGTDADVTELGKF